MIFLFLFACSQEELSMEIPTEAFEWQCYDKQEHTEVSIVAGVCNDLESMTATILLLGENSREANLNHDGGCWWSKTVSQDENCIQIEQIIITAEGGTDGR